MISDFVLLCDSFGKKCKSKNYASNAKKYVLYECERFIIGLSTLRSEKTELLQECRDELETAKSTVHDLESRVSFSCFLIFLLFISKMCTL